MTSQWLWYTTRGAGVISLVLLSAVVCLGLLTRLRVRGEGWPGFLTAAVHQDLALVALFFLGLHIVTAVVDPFTSLGIVAAIVPFGSSYRTVWLGLGTLSFELGLAVGLTSLARRVIGARLWRAVHWLAYACWPLAVFHAVGTRDRRPLRLAAGDHDGLRRCRARLSRLASGRGTAGPAGSAEVSAPDGRERPMSLTPLLDGPDLREGAEPAARHLAQLGPSLLSGSELIDALDQSDLAGRGGAGFPVGRKWRSVAGHQGPRAVIANGAEGEPLSFKDRLLMQARPHLVLDGAALAAGAVAADQIVLYIGREHSAAADAMLHALAERPASERGRIRISRAPVAYVSGEETAAVQFVNRGVALPDECPASPLRSRRRGTADPGPER